MEKLKKQELGDKNEKINIIKPKKSVWKSVENDGETRKISKEKEQKNYSKKP